MTFRRKVQAPPLYVLLRVIYVAFPLLYSQKGNDCNTRMLLVYLPQRQPDCFYVIDFSFYVGCPQDCTLIDIIPSFTCTSRIPIDCVGTALINERPIQLRMLSRIRGFPPS